LLVAETIIPVPSMNLEVEVPKISKEDIIYNLQEIYSAEKWLQTTIMQPYWTPEEVHHHVPSRFPASNWAKLW
jgi:hypothetical protein